MQGFSSFRVAVADRLLPRAAKGHIQNGTEPAMMLVVGNGYSAVPGFSQQNASRTGKKSAEQIPRRMLDARRI